MDNNTICLDSKAYYALVDRLITYIKEKHIVKEDAWITGDEAMRILNISSKTTLQMLRDNGAIRYSHPMHKVILYNRESIIKYIESHAKEIF